MAVGGPRCSEPERGGEGPSGRQEAGPSDQGDEAGRGGSGGKARRTVMGSGTGVGSCVVTSHGS